MAGYIVMPGSSGRLERVVKAREEADLDWRCRSARSADARARRIEENRQFQACVPAMRVKTKNT